MGGSSPEQCRVRKRTCQFWTEQPPCRSCPSRCRKGLRQGFHCVYGASCAATAARTCQQLPVPCMRSRTCMKRPAPLGRLAQGSCCYSSAKLVEVPGTKPRPCQALAREQNARAQLPRSGRKAHVFSSHFALCASGGRLVPCLQQIQYACRGVPTILYAASHSSADGHPAHSQGAYTCCVCLCTCSAGCSTKLASFEVRAQVCCRAATLAPCLLALACTGLFTPWPRVSEVMAK